MISPRPRSGAQRSGSGTHDAVLAAICAILLFAGAPGLRAQRSTPTEYQVKAAYLYNFARFVEWSGNSLSVDDKLFKVCVLGQDPFGATLDSTFTNASIDRKNVTVMRISKPDEVDDCRILFISSSENPRLEQVLGSLSKKTVLTVSDIPRFADRGGMIEFVPDGGKVRFAVNLTSAEDAGISLSSELLKVATNVKRKPHPGD